MSAPRIRDFAADANGMALRSGAAAFGGDTSLREEDFSRRTRRREK